MSTNEELVLSIQAGENQKEIMLQLWKQNKGFIAKLAQKYQGYVDVEDLIQEGYIALYKAVEYYNQDEGIPFINYAAFWIKQYMWRYVNGNQGTVRLPEHARKDIYEYKKAVCMYKKYYGAKPPEWVLCHLLKVSENKLNIIEKNLRMEQIRSLDEPVGEDGDYTLGDMVRADGEREDNCIRKIDREAMTIELWDEIGKLEEGQQYVIKSRYMYNRTLKETGENIGVGIERARQIENKAMKELRKPNRCKKLRCYYEEYLSTHSLRNVGVSEFQRTWTSTVELAVLGK